MAIQIQTPYHTDAHRLHIFGVDIFKVFGLVRETAKKRKMVVKWVAPTYVRGQQGADTTTVFTVK